MHILFILCISLLRSGTEEEYNDLAKLLEDISSYQQDFASMKEESKMKEAQKKDGDRKMGEEM